VKSGRDNPSMVSPLFSFEAEEAIAFQLLHQGWSFVFLVKFWLGCEDFPDEVWIRDGETNGGSEPN